MYYTLPCFRARLWLYTRRCDFYSGILSAMLYYIAYYVFVAVIFSSEAAKRQKNPLHYDSLVFHLYLSSTVMSFCYRGEGVLKLPRQELSPSCFGCFCGYSGDIIMKLRKKQLSSYHVFLPRFEQFLRFSRRFCFFLSATTCCRTRH